MKIWYEQIIQLSYILISPSTLKYNTKQQSLYQNFQNVHIRAQSAQSRKTSNIPHITTLERNVIIYNLCNIQTTWTHTHTNTRKYATVHSSTGLITSEHGTRPDKFIGRLRDSFLLQHITFPARLRSHLSQLVKCVSFFKCVTMRFLRSRRATVGSIRRGEFGAIFMLFQSSVVSFV